MAATLLREVEVLMPLQRFDERGKKRDEAFGADAVGGVPDQEQRVLHVWSVMARTLVRRRLQYVLGMVEQPHSVAAMIACGLDKGIQQRTFLGRRGLAILRGELLEQCTSALKSHSYSHVCLP